MDRTIRPCLLALVLVVPTGCVADEEEPPLPTDSTRDLADLTCRAAVERLSGADRYATAAGVARRIYPGGADQVVIANGETGGPDALVAAPLAADRRGPVLLAAADRLPGPTLEAVRQLGARHAVIVGGSAAVGGEVENALRREGLEVSRLAGADRYKTAARVAREVGAGGPGLAFVASGSALTDAVAGGAAGVALEAPLLFVERDRVPPVTRSALADLGVRQVVILGGPVAVGDSVAAELDRRYRVSRLAGPDRYATAARVAEFVWSETGARRAHLFVARGDDPIDAISVGASGSPVLLSAPGGLEGEAWRVLRRHGKCATVVGGEQVLQLAVERGAYEAIRGPIGGGAGYPRMVEANGPRTIMVRDRPQLLAALEGASDGDVVFVADAATIDLTGLAEIVIPAGVTLASGRGRNGSEGALLHVTSADNRALFRTGGPRVRITGLRIRGPDTSIGPSRDYAPRYLGLDARHDHMRVDNCELWGWAYAAIRYHNARHGRVQHNSIHDNRRTGLGYGVVLMRSADAIVEANLFRRNRHAVAGSGERDQAYVARYNLVQPGAISHVFDMHGEGENPLPGREASRFAGSRIHIHHNTVELDDHAAVFIRGAPVNAALIERNCFAHASAEEAIVQTRFFGGIMARRNRFGHRGDRCY